MEARLKRIAGVLIAALSAGLVAALVLTVVASREQAVREARHELARLGLEDVARRVERSVSNLKSIRAMNDAVAATKARSLAELVAADPSVLLPANRARFEALAKLLDVDELHVSDERGVLVRSLPSVYEGHGMADSKQSAAFMPAITNADFVLVQEPRDKGLATGQEGLDQLIFQYAGVARRDRPGIVQVGFCPARVAEAMKLADVNEIARTTRVGRSGRVRITRLENPLDEPAGGCRTELAPDGSRLSVFEAVCEGYCVAVVLPEPAEFLSAPNAVSLLVVVDMVLFLLLLVALPTVQETLRRDVVELRRRLTEQMGGSASFLRTLRSPLSLAVMVVFLAASVLLGIFLRMSAATAARERLRASASDMVSDLDNCVDAQLVFVGNGLCEAFKTPEEMAGQDLAKLAETYFVDEINVVDGNGVCLNSTVPEIRGSDQWRKPNPAKFNQALLKDGEEVFSQPFRASATEGNVYRKYVGTAFRPPAKGYVQIGFDRVRLRTSIDSRLRELAEDWHIGETGFFIISRTSDGEILSCDIPEYVGQTLAGVGFDVFAARTLENVDRRDPVSRDFLGLKSVNYFVSNVGDRKCLCTSGVVNQFHRYIAAIPLAEVYGGAWRATVLVGSVLLLVLALAAYFLSRLSNLVLSLRGYIAKDRAQREKDLTLAKTIQMSALPLAFPDTERYRIFARMDTAREVGGDFYDFFALPDGRVMFLVADVSGKGIPAALFMMRAKALIRAAALRSGADLAAVVVAANDALAEANEAEMFVTAWIGAIDLKTGELSYVNAGHNAPLVKRADGSVEWLRARSGLVLAAMGGVKYRVQAVKLSPGDSILLYTDGVTEAMDAAGAQYGEERLERTLKSSGPAFVSTIRQDVAAFVGETEQSDDITMLAFDFKSQPSQRKDENVPTLS